jgi:hypothetical protein
MYAALSYLELHEENMVGKIVSPSMDLTAFNCPHCSTLTTQRWYGLYAEPISKEHFPRHYAAEDRPTFDFSDVDQEKIEAFAKFADKLCTGVPVLDRDRFTADYTLYNLSISECFECNQLAIWRSGKLLFPANIEVPQPNPDVSEVVKREYTEAANIVAVSPRGAAALLRLAIQQLCVDLGEGGKNLNDDIASLVKKGLNGRVQKALDIVRVIGNNAVHPGEIDLRDDQSTATQLFRLVNLIADALISQPRRIDEMYGALPSGAVEAIEKRDKKGQPQSGSS